MKLKTFAGRAAAAGAVLAALVLAALPVWAAPRVQVDKKNAVADHADILSAETENYINDISISLSDACGAQIGVYTVDELLGNTTMEGFAYNVFNDWELGSADQNNGVLLLLAPYEADGGDYYIMRGSGLESRLSFSTLGSLLDEYMEPYWATGDYDTGTQKTVQALTDRLCSIYGVTLDSGYTANTAARGGVNVMGHDPSDHCGDPYHLDHHGSAASPRPGVPRGAAAVAAVSAAICSGTAWAAHPGGPAVRRLLPRRPTAASAPAPAGRPASGGPRPSGGFRAGGGFTSGGGAGRSRPSGGFGGSRPSGGGFRSGGGSTRGGGVGRHH